VSTERAAIDAGRQQQSPGINRFRGLELVAGGRYARVSLPVSIVLPVVGTIDLGAGV
jgi:hypothetical protein